MGSRLARKGIIHHSIPQAAAADSFGKRWATRQELCLRVWTIPGVGDGQRAKSWSLTFFRLSRFTWVPALRRSSICSIFLNAAAYATGVASRRSVKRASALATRFPLSCENRDCELPRLCSWILIQ